MPKSLPASYNAPIALIGCGAASISCASFLARLGYKNIHIYEKESYGGGILTNEIPANRMTYNESVFEVELMQHLGVKIFYDSPIGEGGISLNELKEKYEAIFFGSGKQTPKTDKLLGEDMYDKNKNVWNSKNFLKPVSEGTKDFGENIPPPVLNGHTVVIGIGDTALDCARSAFRCGAERVSVVFRRGFSDLRATDEIFKPAFYDGCNFIPYKSPSKVCFFFI